MPNDPYYNPSMPLAPRQSPITDGPMEWLMRDAQSRMPEADTSQPLVPDFSQMSPEQREMFLRAYPQFRADAATQQFGQVTPMALTMAPLAATAGTLASLGGMTGKVAPSAAGALYGSGPRTILPPKWNPFPQGAPLVRPNLAAKQTVRTGPHSYEYRTGAQLGPAPRPFGPAPRPPAPTPAPSASWQGNYYTPAHLLPKTATPITPVTPATPAPATGRARKMAIGLGMGATAGLANWWASPEESKNVPQGTPQPRPAPGGMPMRRGPPEDLARGPAEDPWQNIDPGGYFKPELAPAPPYGLVWSDSRLGSLRGQSMDPRHDRPTHLGGWREDAGRKGTPSTDPAGIMGFSSPAESYRVKKGDTLSELAATHLGPGASKEDVWELVGKWAQEAGIGEDYKSLPIGTELSGLSADFKQQRGSYMDAFGGKKRAQAPAPQAAAVKPAAPARFNPMEAGPFNMRDWQGSMMDDIPRMRADVAAQKKAVKGRIAGMGIPGGDLAAPVGTSGIPAQQQATQPATSLASKGRDWAGYAAAVLGPQVVKEFSTPSPKEPALAEMFTQFPQGTNPVETAVTPTAINYRLPPPTEARRLDENWAKRPKKYQHGGAVNPMDRFPTSRRKFGYPSNMYSMIYDR